MKINCYQFFLILSCCFLMACQTETKSTPASSSTTSTPAAAPKPGTVATPADISEPDEMVNNFQRMQGEWLQADNAEKKLQVRGNVFLEISAGKNQSELANQFKMVKNCEGTIDMNGGFFMVGNRCFKLLNISIEEMEVEDLEQQKVVKYTRI